ncbi:MAG: class I SAM-dependent DNA methyltransferase [Runella sp.]
MQDRKDIIDCYDKTAEKYADKFKNELDWKHFDQIILKAFAQTNRTKGQLIDLGCGPGQTTKFLYDNGVINVLGTDISPEMVKVANKQYPSIKFVVADMLNLNFPEKSFGSAVAFYAIVHFNYEQIKTAFQEISKILIQGGEFLFSFHIGDYTVHMDSFFDEKVNIDFYALQTEKIKELLEQTGFEIIDLIEREPYKDKEYESKRAYIWAKTCH